MEVELVKLIQSLNSSFFDIFCELISYLSNYFGLILLFIILFAFINRKYALFFGFTYGIGISFNYLFKYLFDRPRPYQVDPEIINKLSATGTSFPSGHTVSATIIVCFILYLIFRYSKSKSLKITSIIISSVFIILVGFSRMYLGQHFLTDIFGGILFGLFYSYLGILCYNKISFKEVEYENKRNNLKKRK
jgi:undecaprenyl-diphosphatase